MLEEGSIDEKYALERPIMKTFGFRGMVGVDVDVKNVRMRMYIEKIGVILPIGMYSKHSTNTGNRGNQHGNKLTRISGTSLRI
jgi:hypothetical protein